MKVYVKINPKIAAKGAGFSDIAGKQEVYPPYKDGAPVVDKEFELESTPFVEQKIATGELVLIKREEEKKSTSTETELSVTINGTVVTSIKVAKDEKSEKIQKTVLADELVIAALKDLKTKSIKITAAAVEITAE